MLWHLRYHYYGYIFLYAQDTSVCALITGDKGDDKSAFLKKITFYWKILDHLLTMMASAALNRSFIVSGLGFPVVAVVIRDTLIVGVTYCCFPCCPILVSHASCAFSFIITIIHYYCTWIQPQLEFYHFHSLQTSKKEYCNPLEFLCDRQDPVCAHICTLSCI